MSGRLRRFFGSLQAPSEAQGTEYRYTCCGLHVKRCPLPDWLAGAGPCECGGSAAYHTAEFPRRVCGVGAGHYLWLTPCTMLFSAQSKQSKTEAFPSASS